MCRTDLKGPGMPSMPTVDELRSRIQRDVDHFEGNLPPDFSVAWNGYLAALIEWGLISVSDHEELVRMLPPIEPNPAVQILLGRPETD